MRVISRKKIIAFYSDPANSDSKVALESWFYEAKNASWSSPAGIKEQYKSASVIKDSRMVFNIAGNKYRLVVKIHYKSGIIYIRFIGTHSEYDKINVETI